MKRLLPVFCAVIVLGCCQLGLAQDVSGIVITTDKSVNCASLKTIVDDVCRDCKTDQEKAIAIYNFMVRTVWMGWHSHRPLEMQPDGQLLFVNDPLKYISVYGYLGCSPQAGVLSSLMETAGIESRYLNPGFGHVSCEFKWDGKWHWLDPWLPAYVLKKDGEIASYQEIMDDRTLFTQARQEGRAPANFMVNYSSDLGSVLHAKDWKSGARDPYPQKYVENLCLRPGESCTWLWDNVGKWYDPSGPYQGTHLAGQFPSGPATKFGNDKVLKDAFPYWEPYKKTIEDGPHSAWDKTYYRYYGNAIFTHQPPLTERGLEDMQAKRTDLEVVDGGGLVYKGQTGGQLELSFQLPYVIADSQVEGQCEMGVGGSISLSFSTDGGKTWLLGGEVKQSGAFGPISIGKPNSYEYPAGSTSGQYGYLLKLVFRANSAQTPTVLKGLKVTNTTMLNFYSRPWLEVGKNLVTVSAADGNSLAESPLDITWRWLEDWTEEKAVTHKILKSGQQETIEVGGQKRPKMKSVTITCPAR